MTVIDGGLQANREYVATFNLGGRHAPPRRHVAILTCMDARLQPEKCLGLEIGDAHILRNAGGRASSDAIRSLVISQRMLGTREIIVIHHTECGMLSFTNEQMAQKVRREVGADTGGLDFLPFTDIEQSVRDDVATLRASPLIPRDTPISGAIYDVRTGAVNLIVRV